MRAGIRPGKTVNSFHYCIGFRLSRLLVEAWLLGYFAPFRMFCGFFERRVLYLAATTLPLGIPGEFLRDLLRLYSYTIKWETLDIV